MHKHKRARNHSSLTDNLHRGGDPLAGSFDGKSMREPIVRSTIDYRSPVIRHLEVRAHPHQQPAWLLLTPRMLLLTPRMLLLTPRVQLLLLTPRMLLLLTLLRSLQLPLRVVPFNPFRTLHHCTLIAILRFATHHHGSLLPCSRRFAHLMQDRVWQKTPEDVPYLQPDVSYYIDVSLRLRPPRKIAHGWPYPPQVRSPPPLS